MAFAGLSKKASYQAINSRTVADGSGLNEALLSGRREKGKVGKREVKKEEIINLPQSHQDTKKNNLCVLVSLC